MRPRPALPKGSESGHQPMKRLRATAGAFASPRPRSHATFAIRLRAVAAAVAAAFLVAAGCSGTSEGAGPPGCAPDTVLDFAFYADYAPVSHRADSDPDAPGFSEHAGYEADLLDALEAMDGAGLRFNRIAVAEWSGLWLLPANGEADIAGGGMTILESRTLDAEGNTAVAFTSGHIEFRNVLLIRAADAQKFQSFDDLTSDTVVATSVDTTGEQRLLELTGLSAPHGTLAAGTVIETPSGTLTADGTGAFVVTAAGASENLRDRMRLLPPSPHNPIVQYVNDDATQYDALASGEIDAVSRDNVGAFEQAASHGGGGVLAVGPLDEAVQHGGWTLRADDNELRECLDDKLAYLTDNMAIGFQQWSADNEVFMQRALAWTP